MKKLFIGKEKMFKKFPREVGPPRKVVYNIQEWLNFCNKYNGMKKAVYTSIYKFNIIDQVGTKPVKPEYNSAIIDKIFFDFDDKSCNAWKECNSLHQELLKDNIKHIIIMSGRGYHLYYFSSPLSSENPKSLIYNSQYHFINKLKLTVDAQVIGNPAQLARVPNTFNIKGNRFCIPLTQEQFEKEDKYCKQLASKQNFVKKISIGEKLFDLKPFDYKTNIVEDINFELEFENSVNQNYMNNCDIKIKKLLSKKELGWRERYLVILYFREKGFTMQEVYNILKEHLSKRKFKHCIVEERQLQYLFERDDLMFPENCGIKVYK